MPVYKESALFEVLGVDKAVRNVNRLDKAIQELIKTSRGARSDSDPFASMTKNITASRAGLTGLISQLRTGETAAKRMADQMARISAAGGGRGPGGGNLPGTGGGRVRPGMDRQAAFNPRAPAGYTLRGRPIFENDLGREEIAARTNAMRGLLQMEREMNRERERAARNAEKVARQNARLDADLHGRDAGRRRGHGFDVGREIGRFAPGSLAVHITARTAYLTASALEHTAVEGAKEQSTARERMFQQGYTPDDIKWAVATAQKVGQKYKTTNTADNLETILDIGAAVHGRGEREQLLELLARRQQALVGQGRDSKQVRDENVRLIKTLEETGQLVDGHGHFNAAKTEERLTAIRQVETVEGRNIDARQIQMAGKYMRDLGLTENTKNFKHALFLAAELGGSSTGTGFSQSVRNLTGHARQGALNNLIALGMADADFYEKNGEKKMKKGSFRLKDEELLRENYGAWLEKYIYPVLDKKGIDPKTNPAGLSKFLGTITSDRTAKDYLFKMITQAQEMRNKEEASLNVKTDEKTAIDVTDRDFNAAFVAATKQLEELFGNVGNSLKGVLLPAINAATGGLSGLAALFGEDKSAADKWGTTLGLGIGGAGLAGAGMAGKWAIGKILSPFTSVTIATDANTAATDRNTAALLKGTGIDTATKASGAAASGGFLSWLGSAAALAAPGAIPFGLALIGGGKQRPEEVVRAEARMAEITKQINVLEGNLASGASSDPAKTQAKIVELQAEFNRLKEIDAGHAEEIKTGIDATNNKLDEGRSVAVETNAKLDLIKDAIQNTAINGIGGLVGGSGAPLPAISAGRDVTGSVAGSGSDGGIAPVGSAQRAATRSAMMTVAMDQLRKEGVPEANLKAAAAHLVGQADWESGLRPGVSHDGNTGYGLYGARLGRRDRMLGWSAAKGFARDSAEGQMRYMAHEAMSGKFPGTRRVLMGATPEGFDRDTWVLTKEFEAPKYPTQRSGMVKRAYLGSPLKGPRADNSDGHSNAADKMSAAADKMHAAASSLPSNLNVKAEVKRAPNTGGAGAID